MPKKRNNNVMPHFDRLLPVGVAAETLGVSKAAFLQRGANRERFPGWPVRVIVGRSANGRAMYAVKQSSIEAFIASTEIAPTPEWLEKRNPYAQAPKRPTNHEG